MSNTKSLFKKLNIDKTAISKILQYGYPESSSKVTITKL
jgi:hypothetical protein